VRAEDGDLQTPETEGVQRGTGPDPQTYEKVRDRFGGRCARCGRPGWTVHHRRRRGMGGSGDPKINEPPNLIFLCGDGTRGCHGWIEHNRAEARKHGWLVYYEMDAAAVEVLLWDGRRVLLDADGGWHHVG
jgi:hypothetical protein